MCLFTHVAAGAVAGALAPNAFTASLLGLGSHVLLDIIPHLDIDRMRYELLLACLAIAALAVGGVLTIPVACGIAGGVIPDLENLFWKLGAIRDEQKVFPGHRRFLRHGAPAGATSLYLQGAVSIAVISFLIRRGA